MQLDRDGEVFVLHMRDGENRVQPEFVASWNAALDEVEKHAGPAALVSTGEGKFYSNGLDVGGLADLGEDGVAGFMGDLDRLYARVLCFPRITAAAINGHAFAAGGMLAAAHDRRVTREDRGFFCLPEIDMKLSRALADGMYAVLRARVPEATLHEALATGRRYGGPDAVAAGIFDEVAPADAVLERAVDWARAHAGKDPATLGALKRGLHREALAVLERPGPHPL